MSAPNDSTFLEVLGAIAGISSRDGRQELCTAQIDPLHPSLHFKKVGKLWSVRVGSTHRALAVEDGDD
ncbi:hypothetical protein BN873_10217 [Candidatus Competibacter denitrificans Run_A_D11]|uniref:Uncharacterized protein n=1 Tax=Candidatus Competibacter denitrificans Run_A_D11 TaxID=1400863 RepID=W6M0S3_9GAMM|nr:hypothetical protein BN873_10217 [Candidatus Competibacter denitrificans Run_A_D11]